MYSDVNYMAPSYIDVKPLAMNIFLTMDQYLYLKFGKPINSLKDCLTCYYNTVTIFSKNIYDICMAILMFSTD